MRTFPHHSRGHVYYTPCSLRQPPSAVKPLVWLGASHTICTNYTNVTLVRGKGVPILHCERTEVFQTRRQGVPKSYAQPVWIHFFLSGDSMKVELYEYVNRVVWDCHERKFTYYITLADGTWSSFIVRYQSESWNMYKQIQAGPKKNYM